MSKSLIFIKLLFYYKVISFNNLLIKMKKKVINNLVFFEIFLALFPISSSFAGTNFFFNNFSLFYELEKSSSDTSLKFNDLYRKAVEEYKKSNYKVSESVFSEVLKFYRQQPDTALVSEIYDYLGSINYLYGNYAQAFDFYNNSYSLKVKTRDKVPIINSLINMGMVAAGAGLGTQSLVFLEEAINLSKQINYTKGLAASYNNLAQMFGSEQKYELAERKFTEALNLYRLLADSLAYSQTLSNLATIHYQQNHLTEAHHLFIQAIDIQTITKDNELNLATTYNNFACLLDKLEKPDSASFFHYKAFEIYKKNNNTRGLAKTLYFIGKHFATIANLGVALQNYRLSFEISADLNFEDLRIANAFDLYLLYKDDDKIDSSFKYLETYTSLIAESKKRNSNEKLFILETLLEKQKNEEIIKQMKHEVAIKDLNIEQQHFNILIALAGIVLFTVLLIFLIYNNFQQKVTNKILVHKNKELLEIELQKTENKEYSKNSQTNISTKTNGVHKQVQPAKALLGKLQDLMDRKAYLNPELSLVEAAEMLKTNRTYLSNLFNNELVISFNDYLNNHRVREMMLLLAAPENNNYTIDCLALKAGFKSKSVYSQCFKKITGVTPSAYRKMSQENGVN